MVIKQFFFKPGEGIKIEIFIVKHNGKDIFLFLLISSSVEGSIYSSILNEINKEQQEFKRLEENGDEWSKLYQSTNLLEDVPGSQVINIQKSQKHH